MNCNDAIKAIAKMSNVKLREIAEGLGIAQGTLRNSLSHRTSPSVKRYADMLEICNYRLVAMPRSEKLPELSFPIDGTLPDNGRTRF